MYLSSTYYTLDVISTPDYTLWTTRFMKRESISSLMVIGLKGREERGRLGKIRREDTIYGEAIEMLSLAVITLPTYLGTSTTSNLCFIIMVIFILICK